MNKERHGLPWKNGLFVLLDALVVVFSVAGALLLRFEFNWEQAITAYVPRLWLNALCLAAMLVTLFSLFHLYNSIWRYIGLYEGCLMLLACTVSVCVLFVLALATGLLLPRSCYITMLLLLCMSSLGTRFAARVLHKLRMRRQRRARREEGGDDDEPNGGHIMIIGAGDAGMVLLREINSSKMITGGRVLCMIDDDPKKRGSVMHGIPIVGGRDMIEQAVKSYDINQIVLAMPSATEKTRADILNICKKTHCRLKTIPGLYQLFNGEVSVQKLRDVRIEDLLGRTPVSLDIGECMGYVRGKTVLVTGGGGSIGSEICRQLVKYGVKRLVIFDCYENNAYDILNELKRTQTATEVIARIGSVRDEARLEALFTEFSPDVVYHAAAHKHVPLMEDSPHEAVKNNVFGTLNTVRCADRHHVSRFVMISTDKAVNPTNVMGATKRICEMIIQLYDRRSKTEFVAVRFGNVLGSNGSVIPLFEKQIKAGGPVTVTDPEITRFFMTIPEAVALVLRAGALAKGGEIFVLDMGEAVKIDDLARNMIMLSGYRPDVDIKIKYVGLRPGEKKYEELLLDEEGLTATAQERIHIGKPLAFDEDAFAASLRALKALLVDDMSDIRPLLHDIVPTYRQPERDKKKASA